MSTNPYESPREMPSSAEGRPRWGKGVLASGFLGACVGYVMLFIFANLEDFRFHWLRSLVTGRDAMREIVEHPADLPLQIGLFLFFFGGGAAMGAYAGKCLDNIEN